MFSIREHQVSGIGSSCRWNCFNIASGSGFNGWGFVCHEFQMQPSWALDR